MPTQDFVIAQNLVILLVAGASRSSSTSCGPGCRRLSSMISSRRRTRSPTASSPSSRSLPPIDAHVTEYQCPHVVCRSCRKTTQAPVPDDVTGQFGPQLTALIAYLTVVCRIPRRLMQAVLEDALHVPISVGRTQAAWETGSFS